LTQVNIGDAIEMVDHYSRDRLRRLSSRAPRHQALNWIPPSQSGSCLSDLTSRHQALVRQCNGIGLLSRLGFLPLVKVIDGHETATLLECFPESGLAFDPLGLGVDIGEANFDVLGQNGTRPDRITSKLRSWAFAS